MTNLFRNVPRGEPVVETRAPLLEAPCGDAVLPPSPAPEPVTVQGTIRDKNEETILFADVYLVMNLPREKDKKDVLDQLSLVFRPDTLFSTESSSSETSGSARSKRATPTLTTLEADGSIQ